MLNRKYLITAACIYLAYFTHGIMGIIISQLRDHFSVQWSTDLAGIWQVIAWTGLGKFLTVWICGELSDKVGRRVMMFIGAVSYVIFFVALLVTTNYTVACAAAFLGGAATSCFDGGGYPALQESFPKSPASALMLLKGFISLSGIFYPLMVSALIGTSMFAAVIWLPLILSVIVLALVFVSPFSYDETLKEKRNKTTAGNKNVVEDPAIAEAIARFVKKPSFAIEGTCCLAYGFICMFTFYIVQQSITIYGKDVIGMSDLASRALLSYYTVGAFLGVIIGAIATAKGLRVLTMLLIYTFFSFLSLLVMCLIQTPLVTAVTAFTVGMFAAGGALQAGVALMSEYFPGKKGRNLGMYYTFMGLASYIGPVIAGKFISMATVGLIQGTPEFMAAEAIGKVNLLYFDLLVAAAGFIVMLILTLRYKTIFGVSAFSRKT